LDGRECVHHRLCTQPASVIRHFESVTRLRLYQYVIKKFTVPIGIVSLCSVVACAVSSMPYAPDLGNSWLLRGNRLSSCSMAVLNGKQEGCHQLVASQFFSDTVGA
jgi:hypothetical protein